MTTEADVKPAETLPKVYGFVNGTGSGFYHMVALAEDGSCLAGHASSSPGWAQHDFAHQHKRNEYAKKYPAGYDLLWLDADNADDLATIMVLAEKNRALTGTEEAPSNIQSEGGAADV